MKERSDYFQVIPTEIGVMKGGRFVSKSDFSIKLKYFVEAGTETGFVAEVNSTHLSKKTKCQLIYVVMPIT